MAGVREEGEGGRSFLCRRSLGSSRLPPVPFLPLNDEPKFAAIISYQVRTCIDIYTKIQISEKANDCRVSIACCQFESHEVYFARLMVFRETKRNGTKQKKVLEKHAVYSSHL